MHYSIDFDNIHTFMIAIAGRSIQMNSLSPESYFGKLREFHLNYLYSWPASLFRRQLRLPQPGSLLVWEQANETPASVPHRQYVIVLFGSAQSCPPENHREPEFPTSFVNTPQLG
jgi:hypothetical protein